jgi:PLP dependent protein
MMISERIDQIRARMDAAACSCGREPASVKLVAVTKTVSVDAICEAMAARVALLGESYMQEAIPKLTALAGQPVKWHFIGHLQSKKAKDAVKYFDLIHSVDSVKLAAALDRGAAKINKIQEILIQVNAAGETTKSGLDPDAAVGVIEEISRLSHIRIKGLMTLPPFFDEAPERVRPYFAALAALRDRIEAKKIPGVVMEELSMGMTGDFESAIKEGATLVRIGTAIFGERA